MPTTHPQRRSTRLRQYDYTQAGAYFVTICTHQRASLFGWIVDGEMWLGARGEVVEACWQAIPNHYPQAVLDAFVVMPNHVHGIIVITDASGDDVSIPSTPGDACIAPTARRGQRVDGGIVRADVAGEAVGPLATAGDACIAPTARRGRLRKGTLGAIVGSFKAASTKAIRALEMDTPQPVWQRGYHEHVIRSEAALARIRQYIADNPAKWAFDHDNPANWQ